MQATPSQNSSPRPVQNTARQKIMFGVVSGWGSQFVSLAVGIFTMPLFFRYLPAEELGVWMFIMGTGVFVNLADLGFSPVLGRRMAFELGKGDRSNQENHEGTSYYYRLSLYVSSLTAPLLFMALLLIGGFFLFRLNLSEQLLVRSIQAWLVFCLSQAVTCRFRYLETTLNSHGEVGWQNWVQTVVQIVSLGGYFAVLHFLEGGLVLLTVVVLIRSILNAVMVHRLVVSRIGKAHMARVLVAWGDVKPHVKPAMDMFLITLGAFLILNTDQYFIVSFLGTTALPDYAAAYRLVQVVFTFASTASAMCIPFISRQSAAGDRSGVHRLLMVNTTVGMIIHLAAIALIAVFGDHIIQFWLGKGHFVGWHVLWIFCLMLTLEHHHTIFARFGLSARVDPTWGKISVLSGVINLALTFVGVRWLGLVGVAGATMVSQMATNNWYAVVKTLRIIRLRFSDYVRESALVWLSTGTVLFAAMAGIRLLVPSPLLSVLAGLTVTAAICAGVFLFHLKGKLAHSV